MRLLFLVLLALPVVARAGALVVLDAPCGVVLPDGGSMTAPGHVVVTNFDDGCSIVTCHMRLPVAYWPRRAMQLDYGSTGVQCGAGRNSTVNWQETITAAGMVTLVCRLEHGVF
jgi:hypothetical protein